MDKLIFIQQFLWILIGIAVVVGIAILASFLYGRYGGGGTTEANDDVDYDSAKESLNTITSTDVTAEDKQSALINYFNTASDPNPQTLWDRFWSMF